VENNFTCIIYILKNRKFNKNNNRFMKKGNKKILIVEDEELILHALSDKFRSSGFDVIQAKDGEEALEVALKTHPDIILLDIILPKMDGMSMLKKFREDEIGANTPVILLTNLDYSVGVAKAMEAEAYDYIVKTDWALDDVVKKVREKLNSD